MRNRILSRSINRLYNKLLIDLNKKAKYNFIIFIIYIFNMINIIIS